MSPLSPEQVESIVRRLDFMRTELQDVPKFSGMTQEDYLTDRDRRRSLERLAENVLNASIDIAKILLAAGDYPIPDTYRDALLQLGATGVLSRDLAEQVAELARLRNILAHQYLDIRWNSLKDFINAAPLVLRGFISRVERLVQSYLNDQPPQRA